MNNTKQKVFFTSDTHYSHKNICRATTRWDNPERTTRDYESIEQMNDVIVNGINNKVGKDDLLIHLGDWSFGGKDKILEFRNKINCENISLILGNHDYHIENNISEYDKYFTSTQHYLEPLIDNRKFILCHYPIESWNGMRKGNIMIHGHVHGDYFGSERPNRIDVGIDSHFKYFGSYEPFSLEEIYYVLGI